MTYIKVLVIFMRFLVLFMITVLFFFIGLIINVELKRYIGIYVYIPLGGVVWLWIKLVWSNPLF